MPITLITGVPGTGKTAFVVSELEKIAASRRVIFVDNIAGLTIPHYRAGKVQDWQKGTWLHIDQFKRTTASVALSGKPDDETDDESGNENWQPRSDVVKTESGDLLRLAFDEHGEQVGTVPYESHKGALLVIDEAQRHFRPRPSGSVVPDHVAALEVHRHQGLDIWLVTQRPGLIDANVRALCGKHIALRSTPLGRYKYEWPEVGDIESKSSRDTAAKSRYKLPKHVFNLYKSAEVHTAHKHSLPLAAKVLLLLVPLSILFFFMSFKTISGKFNPPAVAQAQKPKQQAAGSVQHADYSLEKKPSDLPPGLEPFSPKEIENDHPYNRVQFSIVGRLKSATKDLYRFSASENGQHAFYISNIDLESAGYLVLPINDCSVKIVYKAKEFFVTCAAQPVQQVGFQPQLVQVTPEFSP